MSRGNNRSKRKPVAQSVRQSNTPKQEIPIEHQSQPPQPKVGDQVVYFLGETPPIIRGTVYRY
jgi:hypothetical protein